MVEYLMFRKKAKKDCRKQNGQRQHKDPGREEEGWGGGGGGEDKGNNEEGQDRTIKDLSPEGKGAESWFVCWLVV